MLVHNTEPLIRLRDYEALQAECEKLAEALEACLEVEERPKIIELARAALAAYRKGGSDNE